MARPFQDGPLGWARLRFGSLRSPSLRLAPPSSALQKRCYTSNARRSPSSSMTWSAVAAMPLKWSFCLCRHQFGGCLHSPNSAISGPEFPLSTTTPSRCHRDQIGNPSGTRGSMAPRNMSTPSSSSKPLGVLNPVVVDAHGLSGELPQESRCHGSLRRAVANVVPSALFPRRVLGVAVIVPIGASAARGVTELVLMLATNGYITGQTINVNGGWYMS